MQKGITVEFLPSTNVCLKVLTFPSHTPLLHKPILASTQIPKQYKLSQNVQENPKT